MILLPNCRSLCVLATWEQAENHCKRLGGHLFSFTDKKDLNHIAKLLNILNDSHDKPRQYWTGLRCNDIWCFSDGTNGKNASKLLNVETQRFHPKGKCAYIEREDQAPSLQPQLCTKRADSICQFHNSGVYVVHK